MRTSALKSQNFLPIRFRCTNLTNPSANPSTFTTMPIKTKTNPYNLIRLKRPLLRECASHAHSDKSTGEGEALERSPKSSQMKAFTEGNSRVLVVGAMSVGFVLLLMGMDDHKAMAFGPQGPLVEEFWENVRRYALYALTVSTGALYTILQPIFELLKNPISAILLLVILGGTIFIISQVLSAMVGVTEFSYDYGY
ncbi:hypothetical protein AB3S75_007923 [Citrus x aurantiifolia]